MNASRKKKRRSLGTRLMIWGPTRWLSEFWLRIAIWWITLLGPRWAYWWARRFAWFMWTFLRRLRWIALRNVDLCLPEKSETERTRIARASFNHACYTFIDYLLIPKLLSDDRWRDFVEILPGAEEYHEWVSRDQPSFSLSAHFGNWEMLTFVSSRMGVSFSVVARPINPPALNRRIDRMREFCGSEVIEKEGALRGLVKAMRANRPIAMLVDQNGGDFAPLQDFFGVAARWQADFARLAMRGGGRVAMAFCLRDGARFRFLYNGGTPHQFTKGTDPMEVVRVYGEALEEAIRKHPEQYFWMHRRFKGRPEGVPDRYANLKQRLHESAHAQE